MDIAREICTDSFYTVNGGLPRVPLTAVVYDCLLCSPVIGLDLESHSREKVQFFETRSRIILLALTWRDEIKIII